MIAFLLDLRDSIPPTSEDDGVARHWMSTCVAMLGLANRNCVSASARTGQPYRNEPVHPATPQRGQPRVECST